MCVLDVRSGALGRASDSLSGSLELEPPSKSPIVSLKFDFLSMTGIVIE